MFEVLPLNQLKGIYLAQWVHDLLYLSFRWVQDLMDYIQNHQQIQIIYPYTKLDQIHLEHQCTKTFPVF